MKILSATALLTLLSASAFLTACSNTSSPESRPAAEVAAQEVRGPAGEHVTTPEMRRALSADLAVYDSLVVVAEDSVLAVLGADFAAGLAESRQLWLEYRAHQCELLRTIFEGGTVAPVVELECLVYITDNRLTFIYDHYAFVERIAAMKRAGRAGTAP